jgi:hypothetical protein
MKLEGSFLSLETYLLILAFTGLIALEKYAAVNNDDDGGGRYR